MLLVRIGNVKAAGERIALKGYAADDSLGDVGVMCCYFVWTNGAGVLDEAYCDHEAVFVKHLRMNLDTRIIKLPYVGEPLCVLVDVQLLVKEIRKLQLLPVR